MVVMPFFRVSLHFYVYSLSVSTLLNGNDNVSSKLMKLTNVQRVTVFIWPSFLGMHRAPHSTSQPTICAHVHTVVRTVVGWCVRTAISLKLIKPCLDERIRCLSSFSHNNHLISMLISCWFSSLRFLWSHLAAVQLSFSIGFLSIDGGAFAFTCSIRAVGRLYFPP